MSEHDKVIYESKEDITAELEKVKAEYLTDEKKEEYHKAFLSEYYDTMRGFDFHCERFGDFLMVKVQLSDIKVAKCINLSHIRSIELSRGTPVTSEGTIRFMQSETGLLNNDGVVYKPIYAEIENEGIEIHDLICNYSDSKSGFVYMRHPSLLDTETYPNPSKPDQIFLRGFGYIYAPFKKGDYVLQKILTAIQEGAKSEININVSKGDS